MAVRPTGSTEAPARESPPGPPRCRSCGSRVEPVLSLGEIPLVDALLRPEDLDRPEPRFPLDVVFCPGCTLVQLAETVPPETLFVENYLYFSSYSDELLRHAREHALGLIESRRLGPGSLVVEVASNDGYLLSTFAERGIPVLGIDPAPAQAAAARAAGIPTVEAFFGEDLARRLRGERRPADVVIANNVMAHTPDLNGFVAGLRTLVADDGLVTIENPSVRDLVERHAFDTIYHEHVSYFSCTAVDALVRRHGLSLNRVEYFPDLHGGTLRWHVSPRRAPDASVAEHLSAERELGMDRLGFYRRLAAAAQEVRTSLVELLRRLVAEGRTVAAYGAAAKGATLLNYAGVGTELVRFVVDRNPHKQGLYMPGVRLPIRPPEALLEEQPDFVLLLAWNFEREVLEQQADYRRRGGRFIVPVPAPRIVG